VFGSDRGKFMWLLFLNGAMLFSYLILYILVCVGVL
jgi:hypothetical protein